VARCEARVHGPEGPGIAFDHLCLEVEADGPWLVDVGFGSAFAQPLRLDVGPAGQHDPAGVFRIVEADDGWYDLLQDDAAQYRFSRRPRALADFADGCRHHQTSPESHFTQGTVCTLPVDGGRITMAGTSLIRTTAAGGRTTTPLTTDQVGPVLANHFGIHLTPDQIAKLTTRPA
jgi:N-hydroxyarylamine O-acetyltransferase